MKNYIVSTASEEFKIRANDAISLDLIQVDDKTYHLIQDNKSYQIELVSVNFIDKKMTLSVNGNKHTITLADEYDQMVKKMGLLEVTSQKTNTIKAPMPGLIIDVLVEEGQKIKEGDQLIILSAMKMENILSAPNNGIIVKIEVAKDDAVDKNQVLIQLA